MSTATRRQPRYSACGLSRRGTALFISVTILLAIPHPGWSQPDKSIQSPPTFLTVSSVPVGASISLDGAAMGTAPLVLSVPPGEHHLILMKPGYLENRRVIRLRPGDEREVSVTLTPVPGNEQDTIAPEEDNARRKWPIVLALVGAATAVATLTTSGNQPPVTGSITVDPAAPGLTAITSFRFSAPGASDPNEDPLSFTWDFGDGASASGASSAHIYSRDGDFTVTLTVSDGEETATASATVTTRSLTGNWSGSFPNVEFTMNLTQSGTTVTGTYRDPFVSSATVDGNVRSTLQVELLVAPPAIIPATFRGNLDVNLDRVSGTIVGSGFNNEPFTMTRR